MTLQNRRKAKYWLTLQNGVPSALVSDHQPFFPKKDVLMHQHFRHLSYQWQQEWVWEKERINLQKNNKGYPILLSLEEINHHGLEYKKKLIGKFMSDVYGL